MLLSMNSVLHLWLHYAVWDIYVLAQDINYFARLFRSATKYLHCELNLIHNHDL